MLTQARVRQAADMHRPPPGRGRNGERAVRARGRDTVARLLAAGLAEFEERGFHAVTVDDVVRRASTSHGTFYLYFANKDDLFGALAAEALRAMDRLSDEFPVVTTDGAGRAALRKWVTAFCDTYQAHAPVMRILSQADVIDWRAWESGLNSLLRMADVISLGMTAAGPGGQNGAGGRVPGAGSRLSAVACLMMLERVNYLASSGVRLPRDELVDRMTAIIVAAFSATAVPSSRMDRRPGESIASSPAIPATATRQNASPSPDAA
jgi:AcrR family transcriptional regulator